MSRAPERIGPYRITGELGRGGMGVVYRAVHDDGRPAAIKVLSRELSMDMKFIVRFEREARAANVVRHPNVVSTLGSGLEGQLAWIAFELVDGGTLRDLLKQRGRLPWREVARLGAQIARGLGAIHAAGLVHRDVKPANILVDRDGTAKLADLGLVRRSQDSSEQASIDLTNTGELLGTLDFLSPEQADSAKRVDSRSDLYSLGATLYDLVAGRPPFAGTSGIELIKNHLLERPAPPRSIVPDIPESLDRLIVRLLEKSPDARGPGAVEVAKELAAIGGVASSSKSRTPIVAGAFALVAIAGVAAVLAHRKPTATGETPTDPTPRERPRPAWVDPHASEPQWFKDLTRENRPSWPIKGLELGKEKGEYVNAKDGSVLVFVPGKGPVAPFFIGKYELDNSHFEAFVKEKAYVTFVESEGKGGKTFQDTVADHGNWDEESYTKGTSWRVPYPGETCQPDHPVVQVSPEDAAAYCSWAGLRLPSEEEWLHAASRSGERFPWGRDGGDPGARLGNFGDAALKRARPAFKGTLNLSYDDGYARTSPVGTFPKGASWCGALDMVGNVWELVSGAYMPGGDGVDGAQSGPPVKAPPSADVGKLGMRLGSAALGGGYLTGPANVSGVEGTVQRQLVAPHIGFEDIGFRVARDAR
jgi:serine/threonine-protein kinase